MQSGGGSSSDGGGDGGSSGSGDDSGDEPVADPNCGDDYVLYNYQTHQSYTQQDVIDGNAGDWVLLDEDEWPDYNHPAYYDSGVHQVLDCTEGDSVGAWSLADPNSGGSHGDGGTDSDSDGGSDGESTIANPACDDSYVLYNYQTTQLTPSKTSLTETLMTGYYWTKMMKDMQIIITLHTMTVESTKF